MAKLGGLNDRHEALVKRVDAIEVSKHDAIVKQWARSSSDEPFVSAN
jgi:hypothetical protein